MVAARSRLFVLYRRTLRTESFLLRSRCYRAQCRRRPVLGPSRDYNANLDMALCQSPNIESKSPLRLLKPRADCLSGYAQSKGASVKQATSFVAY